MEIGYQFINITAKNNAIPFEPSNYTLKYVHKFGTIKMSNQLEETEHRRGMKRTIKYKNVIKDWGLVKIYSNRTIHLNDNAWKQYSSEIRDENNELKTRVLASSVSVQLGDEIVCGSSEKSPYEVK